MVAYGFFVEQAAFGSAALVLFAFQVQQLVIHSKMVEAQRKRMVGRLKRVFQVLGPCANLFFMARLVDPK